MPGHRLSRQMRERAQELNKSIQNGGEFFENMVNDILLEDSVRE